MEEDENENIKIPSSLTLSIVKLAFSACGPSDRRNLSLNLYIRRF